MKKRLEKKINWIETIQAEEFLGFVLPDVEEFFALTIYGEKYYFLSKTNLTKVI